MVASAISPFRALSYATYVRVGQSAEKEAAQQAAEQDKAQRESDAAKHRGLPKSPDPLRGQLIDLIA